MLEEDTDPIDFKNFDLRQILDNIENLQDSVQNSEARINELEQNNKNTNNNKYIQIFNILLLVIFLPALSIFLLQSLKFLPVENTTISQISQIEKSQIEERINAIEKIQNQNYPQNNNDIYLQAFEKRINALEKNQNNNNAYNQLQDIQEKINALEQNQNNYTNSQLQVFEVRINDLEQNLSQNQKNTTQNIFSENIYTILIVLNLLIIINFLYTKIQFLAGFHSYIYRKIGTQSFEKTQNEYKDMYNNELYEVKIKDVKRISSSWFTTEKFEVVFEIISQEFFRLENLSPQFSTQIPNDWFGKHLKRKFDGYNFDVEHTKHHYGIILHTLQTIYHKIEKIILYKEGFENNDAIVEIFDGESNQFYLPKFNVAHGLLLSIQWENYAKIYIRKNEVQQLCKYKF